MGKKKSGKTKGIKMSIAEFTQKMGYKQESLLPTAPAIKQPTENENKDAYLEKSNWRGSRVPEHCDDDNGSMQLSAADTDTNWRRKKPPLHTNQTESLNNFNRGSFGQRNSSDQRNGSDQRTSFGSQRNGETLRQYKGKYTSNNKTDNGFIPRWRKKQVKEEEENKPKTMLEIITNDLEKENKPRWRKKKKKKKKNEFADTFIPMTEEEKKHVMLRIQQMEDEENKLNSEEEVDSNGELIEKEDLDEINNF